MREQEAAIEAILFACGEAVEAEKLAKALEMDTESARRLVHGMMERYDSEERGIHIVELDGAFQMCTRPEMFDYLVRIAKQPRKAVLTDEM